jgi:hypothetical protein
MPTPSDSLRRLQSVVAGERLSGRLPRTWSDGAFLAGVKGSRVQIPPSRLVSRGLSNNGTASGDSELKIAGFTTTGRRTDRSRSHF